jgi:hypothetical protein
MADTAPSPHAVRSLARSSGGDPGIVEKIPYMPMVVKGPIHDRWPRRPRQHLCTSYALAARGLRHRSRRCLETLVLVHGAV